MLLTVVRAGAALELFRRQSEWGVTAVALELGIAKSQAYELLNSLCATGLVRRSGRGRYRLGWATVSLGNELLRHEFGCRTRSVRRLAASTRQVVHVAALDRGQIVVLATCIGADRGFPPDGILDEPLHATAAGKLLLALSGDGVEPAVSTPGLTAVGGNTHQSASVYESLKEVARRGHATDLGEFRADRRGLAAPILAADGSVMAALALTTTAARWAQHSREYALLVRREAHLLSHDLRQTAAPAVEATRVA